MCRIHLGEEQYQIKTLNWAIIIFDFQAVITVFFFFFFHFECSLIFECYLQLTDWFINFLFRMPFASENYTIFNINMFLTVFRRFSMNQHFYYVGEFLVRSKNRAMLILINQLHAYVDTEYSNRCSTKQVFSQSPKGCKKSLKTPKSLKTIFE